MKRPIVFLDDGGVMNDNHRRGPQWQRLVGEFFPPLLGGTAEAWAEANRVVATRLFEPANWRPLLRAAPDVAAFYRSYDVAWLGGMCELVEVPAPPEQNCLELAERAARYVTLRVRSAFPGAVEAIRQLHDRGYQLHTASGERSLELAGYLEGMGVRQCFGHLYGPDLAEAPKDGPDYYERIFADASVAPSDALVVDDSPDAIGWATQTGARAVLVSRDALDAPNGVMVVRSLAELPREIERVD